MTIGMQKFLIILSMVLGFILLAFGDDPFSNVLGATIIIINIIPHNGRKPL